MQLVEVGGMSHIYRAKSKSSENTVIIKILNFNKTESPQVIKNRLALEGIISAKLNHPAICKTLDYVYDDEGNYGLVLENLIGNNLDVIINMIRAPFSLKEALVIIFEVSAALKYAHSSEDGQKNKIIHRDLKPSNIFITDDMRIKLLDFGIAHELNGKFHSIHNNEGYTKCYTPPDLWRDEKNFHSQKYNETHDIYCLGLIFYELLTKNKAFKNLPENQKGLIKCVSEFGHTDSNLILLFKKWTHVNPSERFGTIDELLIALTGLEITYFESNKLFDLVSENGNEATIRDEILSATEHLNKTNTDNGSLDIAVDVAVLNILRSIQVSVNNFEIEKDLKLVIGKISKSSNQINTTINNIDYQTFSIRALASARSSLLKNNSHPLTFTQNQTLNQLIFTFKNILTPNECYNVYSKIYKSLQNANLANIHLITKSLRDGFSLDPFICDDDKNCEGFQESLAATLFVMLNQENIADVRKFIHNSIRFYKIPDEEFYVNTLRFYENHEKNILTIMSDYEKQVIYFTVANFAFADKKIDPTEKEFLDNVHKKINFKKGKFDLLINKDSDELFNSISDNSKTYTLLLLFSFLIRKQSVSSKEITVLKSIFTQYVSSLKKTPLSFNNSLLVIDFTINSLGELSKNRDVVNMLAVIQKLGIPSFKNKLVSINQVRAIIFKTPKKSISHLNQFIELLGLISHENQNDPLPKENKLINLHLYYIYLREFLCYKNSKDQKTVIHNLISLEQLSLDNLPRDFDSILSWKIPYFIMKYFIGHSREDKNSFNKLQSPEFRSELNGVLYELRINDKSLQFAQKMILINYGIDLKF